MTSIYDQAILADSPLAYYHLSEASGTVAVDLSGYGNNGKLVGVLAYSQPGAVPNDTDTSILFSASGGIVFPYTLIPYSYQAISLDFLINLGAGWHYVATTMDNTSGTVLYLDDTQVQSQQDAMFLDIFLGSNFQYDAAGSVLSAGYLAKVALYPYKLSPGHIANHRQTFNQAVANPIQQYLLVNPGYISGFPGNFPGNEYVTVDMTKLQVVSTIPLPRNY